MLGFRQSPFAMHATGTLAVAALAVDLSPPPVTAYWAHPGDYPLRVAIQIHWIDTGVAVIIPVLHDVWPGYRERLSRLERLRHRLVLEVFDLRLRPASAGRAAMMGFRPHIHGGLPFPTASGTFPPCGAVGPGGYLVRSAVVRVHPLRYQLRVQRGEVILPLTDVWESFASSHIRIVSENKMGACPRQETCAHLSMSGLQLLDVVDHVLSHEQA